MRLLERYVYICSDSVGETAETVVRATLRQFHGHSVKTIRYAHMRHEDEIRAMMEDAASRRGFVAYTLVQPELREMLRLESVRLGVRAVDIMGPMMQAFVDTFNDVPMQKPGLLHQLDEEYFRRMEAIEFAVKCDDGRDTQAVLKAKLVLIGVSRTSKTPLSIYLAHKGVKVANFPIVPEVKVPPEIMSIAPDRVVGLTMSPEQMIGIRSERLKAMGLPQGARYATAERIVEELAYAQTVFRQVGCRVIDVSNNAIEETAALILEGLPKR